MQNSPHADDTPRRARLIYCKPHVFIHPTQFNKDNISGHLALVDDPVHNGGLVVAWVPDQVLQRMDRSDRESFQKVETLGRAEDEKGIEGIFGRRLTADYVFISLPPPKGEQYAFSVPITSIYSILAYPVRQVVCIANLQPSYQHWYGSATFK